MVDVFLTMLYKHIRQNFIKNGGWTSKKNIMYVILFLWGMYTFFRERGWLPKKSLKGKHVFLTGAGSGIGRLLAIKLAKMGAKISISDLKEDTVIQTSQMIFDQTGTLQNVLAMHLDVCNRAQITECCRKAERTFGEVDIVINNAGVV